MSTVQKVFVVLIFTLAATFTGLSLQMLSTEQHWKEKFRDKEKELAEYKKETDAKIKDLETKITSLEKKQTELEAENKTLQENLNNSEERNQRQAKEISDLRQTERVLRNQITDLQKQNKDYKDKLDAKTADFIKEKKRAEDLVKLYHFKQAELADVISELNELKQKHASLLEVYRKNEEELRVAKELLDIWKKKYHIEEEGIGGRALPVKPIEGKVLAVTKSKETGLNEIVMLSVGRQDDVKVGYEFVIYRGETYICKVVVKEVFEDSAVAMVIPESVNRDEQGNLLEVKQYDSASTKIF